MYMHTNDSLHPQIDGSDEMSLTKEERDKMRGSINPSHGPMGGWMLSLLDDLDTKDVEITLKDNQLASQDDVMFDKDKAITKLRENFIAVQTESAELIDVCTRKEQELVKLRERVAELGQDLEIERER